jgi:hypothetical protein
MVSPVSSPVIEMLVCEEPVSSAAADTFARVSVKYRLLEPSSMSSVSSASIASVVNVLAFDSAVLALDVASAAAVEIASASAVSA